MRPGRLEGFGLVVAVAVGIVVAVGAASGPGFVAGWGWSVSPRGVAGRGGFGLVIGAALILGVVPAGLTAIVDRINMISLQPVMWRLTAVGLTAAP